MAFLAQLQTVYDGLNHEQRQAVDRLDGPVLVVAGPGTGKTQLLSLRVANILDKCDVQPSNILCLTFTEAGAEAMQRRLVSFIGRDAYAVQISTFHSFAQLIRANYPEFFERSAFDSHITSLQSKKLIERLLSQLDYTDPLYQKPFEGNYGNLSPVTKLIGNFKKAGLNPDELRRIIHQNLSFFDYAINSTEILQRINAGIPTAAKEKQEFLDDLQSYLTQILEVAPTEIKQSVVETPGIYSPYICYFIKQFRDTELYQPKETGGAGKTLGYQELRANFFTKDKNGQFVFKDYEGSQKLLSVVDIYQRYQAEFAEQALYDYDDMILDVIAAISTHPQLKAILQEQYQYLLVDEFQDTNGSQMRLLDLISDAGSNPNILAVGDDDQAIMRFQGASVEYLKQFEQHYQSVWRIVLKTNYRSTPQLVELGQKIAAQVDKRAEASINEKHLEAFRQAVPQAAISAKQYVSQDVQYYQIAQSIKERIDSGFVQNAKNPAEAIAVIAAKHGSLRAMIPYLKAFDIAYNYRVTTQLTEIASLQTLFTLMHFIIAYADLKLELANSYLPQILAAPEFGFCAPDYFDFAIQTKKQRSAWLWAMQNSPDQKKVDLAGWLIELAKKSHGSPARQIIFELIKPLSEYYKKNENSDPFTAIEFNYGVKKLIDFTLEEHQAGQALGTIRRPMLLKDVQSILKDVDRFREEINISIPVERADAINLTSAHGSKGLEYDMVYLIDADKKTWTGSRSESVTLSQNMLFGTTKDADDARRLLFVALTRARTELEVSFAKGDIVSELVDEISVDKIAVLNSEIVKQSEISWENNYYPNNPELLEILRSSLTGRKMSASLLNKFLAYDGKDGLHSGFVLQSLVQLPGAPIAALDFGSIIHKFFEEYLNKVVKSNQSSVEQLVETCKLSIQSLDFESEQLEPLLQRFDLIVQHFLPKLRAMFTGGAGSSDGSAVLDVATTYLSEQQINCVLDGIPLIGYCDLLELNPKTRTIRIFDYKTGKSKTAQPDRDYLRQLQFYKLLIENSAHYQGWTVSGGADIFVEPERPNWSLAEPQFVSVSDQDLDKINTLIKAVWQRIQTANFDVSEFEASRQLASLKANSTKKNGPTKAEVQAAFEDWIIASY